MRVTKAVYKSVLRMVKYNECNTVQGPGVPHNIILQNRTRKYSPGQVKKALNAAVHNNELIRWDKKNKIVYSKIENIPCINAYLAGLEDTPKDLIGQLNKLKMEQ